MGVHRGRIAGMRVRFPPAPVVFFIVSPEGFFYFPNRTFALEKGLREKDSIKKRDSESLFCDFSIASGEVVCYKCHQL